MSTSRKQMLICPYCGNAQAALDRCRACGGLFEPLSRQATHNAMGPWQVRTEQRPFQPGCSYETMVKLIERGQVNKLSIIRGPTTKQFWTIARRVPGIAHLLGYCHNCDAPVDADDHGCHSCGVPFGAYLDRNYLGLPEIKPLPWEAPADELGAAAAVTASPNRMSALRPPGPPVGISSFATDEELRGAIMPPTTVIPGGSASTAFSAMPSPADSWTPPPTDDASAVEAREMARKAMERTMAEQQRTIRVLLAVLAVMVVATIIVFVALTKGRGSAGELNDGVTDSRSPEREPSDVAAAKPPSTPGTPGTQPSSVEPRAASQPATAPEPTIESQLQQIEDLLAEARRDDRPRADRIQSYESAITLMKRLMSNSAVEPNDGLAVSLNAALEERDRLKLELYFP